MFENQQCEKCGGELLEGQLVTTHGVFFYPMGEIKKFRPKRRSITCSCCKTCGAIQNIRAVELDKLK